LAAALDDRLSVEWSLAGPIAVSGLPPLDELYAELHLEDDPSSRRSVASLIKAFDSKRVIVVTGLTIPHWPAWQRFLDDYSNASRALPMFDRTLLLAIATGVPKGRLPAKAPVLRPLVWDGVVGEADVFSYVTQAWRSRGRPIDAQAKLMARIITRLALWDFDLADRLLTLDPRILFDPDAALRAAIERDPAYERLGDTWEEGGSAQFDGDEMRHAVALLRLGDRDTELSMRLWAAQAAELLPALELNRRHLAKRMKDARLPLPVTLNGETIHDPGDIEIGPLLRLAREYRVPRDIVRLAEKYWLLRNKLAHLEPLSADEALDPEVLTGRRR